MQYAITNLSTPHNSRAIYLLTNLIKKFLPSVSGKLITNITELITMTNRNIIVD